MRWPQHRVGGFVTDGGIRDTPDISKLEIRAYHERPSAPPNLTKYHAVAVNDPIACGGLLIFLGDMIVGDNEGVVYIPVHIVSELADEALEMTYLKIS